jgi:preprotein translocase subunit SecA
VTIPFDRCFESGHNYVAIEHASYLQCSECIRLNQSCENLSLEHLEYTTREYQCKINEDEKKLAQLLARLRCNRILLQQAEKRVLEERTGRAAKADAVHGSGTSSELRVVAGAGLSSMSPAALSYMDFLGGRVADILGTTAATANDSVYHTASPSGAS